jgi:Arc/MetJ family transcription regulator
MPERGFTGEVAPCPHLPEVDELLTAESLRRLGAERGRVFYVAALRYSQSLWREGKPAQAILQLNRAWSADLRGDEEELARWASPWRALAWMLEHARDGHFLGNPVRHFQHLATRMSGPLGELRSWRAWGCFHVAEGVLGAEGFPRDLAQVGAEGVIFPPPEEVGRELARLGWPGEAELFADLLAGRSGPAERSDGS